MTTHLAGDERDTTRTEAARLYATGLTIRVVAKKIDRSYGNTRVLLLEAGVKLRSKGGYHPKTT